MGLWSMIIGDLGFGFLNFFCLIKKKLKQQKKFKT